MVRTVRLKKVQHAVDKAVAKRKVRFAPSFAHSRVASGSGSSSPQTFVLNAAVQHWTKFGDARGIKPGPDPATTNVGESIPLKLSAKVNTVRFAPFPRPLRSPTCPASRPTPLLAQPPFLPCPASSVLAQPRFAQRFAHLPPRLSPDHAGRAG